MCEGKQGEENEWGNADPIRSHSNGDEFETPAAQAGDTQAQTVGVHALSCPNWQSKHTAYRGSLWGASPSPLCRCSY